MKPIEHNQLFRNRLIELQNKLEQARCVIPNHMPSFGFVAEAILRDFLKSVLPQKVAVGQGFVECDGELSCQCDIILYDAINYAPVYSFGEIVIVPYNSVFAVIEVKTSISAKRFGEVLFAFERLNRMRVCNKFLFLYKGCKIKTLRKYFYGEYTPIYGRSYDYDDFYSLPDAIVSLNNDYYLSKSFVETADGREGIGYESFSTYDNSDKTIACLQEFVGKLLEIVTLPIEEDSLPPLCRTTDVDNHDALKTMKVNDGFSIVYW